jgi:hypothetical protein
MRHAISATAVVSVDAHQTSVTVAVTEVDLDQGYRAGLGYHDWLLASRLYLAAAND